eukprot:m.1115567 g.1115567  ORF g.1115567 m.1115567 type:complete len:94 (+) comp24370_c0_seq30:1748-2029(+)
MLGVFQQLHCDGWATEADHIVDNDEITAHDTPQCTTSVICDKHNSALALVTSPEKDLMATTTPRVGLNPIGSYSTSSCGLDCTSDGVVHDRAT